MVVRRIYQVGEVTGYLHDLLERDTLLSDLWVRGEISNFKQHTSGHLYFTIKDYRSAIRCVMFRSRANQLTFLPANGISVLVRGYITVYERDGVYQLYAEELAPDGMGTLYQAFCRLKERLDAQGLFALEHKRPLPYLPRRVGVVTSANGAAWHDLYTVMRRRYPGIPIVLAPAAVQGEQAPAEICAALALLNRRTDIDLIITGRGGGSLEELWAFNTEQVAQAVYHSRIPVISAVGHETDFTIVDLVADLRAPTPSAAAELAVPELLDLQQQVLLRQDRLLAAMERIRVEHRLAVQSLDGSRLSELLRRYAVGKQESLRLIEFRLLQQGKGMSKQERAKVQLLAGKLEALSPLAILERGYALCQNAEGKIVQDCSAVQQGEAVSVLLRDGRLQCQVEDVKEEPGWLAKANRIQN